MTTQVSHTGDGRLYLDIIDRWLPRCLTLETDVFTLTSLIDDYPTEASSLPPCMKEAIKYFLSFRMFGSISVTCYGNVDSMLGWFIIGVVIMSIRCCCDYLHDYLKSLWWFFSLWTEPLSMFVVFVCICFFVVFNYMYFVTWLVPSPSVIKTGAGWGGRERGGGGC